MANPTLPSDENSKSPSEAHSDSTLSLPGDSAQPSPAAPSSPSAAQTIADRLAAVTSSGGLTALPPDFDDSNGDWRTVASDDVFERLYLDARQWQKITPEMVAAHAALLGDFWNDKQAKLSQGAAKHQFVEKYGDGNEAKVRTYSARVRAAHNALRTPELISFAAD